MSKTWLYPGILRALRYNPARMLVLRRPILWESKWYYRSNFHMIKSTISLDQNFPWPCLTYKVEYFALNYVDKSFTSRVLLIFKRLSTYHVWSVIIQYQFSHLLVHG